VQELPQESTLVFDTHWPAQTCSPPGQAVATQRAPEQPVCTASVGQTSHWPLQSRRPPSHEVATHCSPSQVVAVAPAGHGAQVLPQARCVEGHERPQLVPSQVALPTVGTGQGEQRLPQVARSVLGTHAVPQRCVPGEQPHSLLVGLQKPGWGHSLSDPVGQRTVQVPLLESQSWPLPQPVSRHPASKLPPSLGGGGATHWPRRHSVPEAHAWQVPPAEPQA
jgi:hypothetical protein